jgi:putative two-component system response regulator
MGTLDSTINLAISGRPPTDVLAGIASDVRDSLTDATVMMIDDEPANNAVAQLHLKEVGFTRFIACSKPREAIETMMAKQPDVLLLDLIMPELSGFEILTKMDKDPSLKRIPVIILTSAENAEAKLKALKMGAADYLSKPVEAAELAFRLKNILTMKMYHDQLAKQTALLEQEVRLRTNETKAAQQQVLLSLASAGEFRDEDTGMHVVRVGRYSGILARYLGASEEWVRMIEQAAPLHDVGKIGIPDSILLKPGPLSAREFDVMKQHGIIGTQIISAAARKRLAVRVDELAEEVESPIMRMAAVIAETHHEQWDGSGYPRGLKGEEIAPEGRIVAVADVYDALSNSRPYKEALPSEQCFEIIRQGRGTGFDPRVVDAFFSTADEIMTVQRELGV